MLKLLDVTQRTTEQGVQGILHTRIRGTADTHLSTDQSHYSGGESTRPPDDQLLGDVRAPAPRYAELLCHD